jgi:putative peptide maturation dehydrogenase
LFSSFLDCFVPDLKLLLNGGGLKEEIGAVVLYPITHGRPVTTSWSMIQLLSLVPADRWIPINTIANDQQCAEDLYSLASFGAVLIDIPDDVFLEFRRREEVLESEAWAPISAFHYIFTKWSNVHLKVKLPKNISELASNEEDRNRIYAEFTNSHGRPPPHFHHRGDCIKSIPMPVVDDTSELATCLIERSTCRVFDEESILSLRDFSILTRYCFGAHGIKELFPGVTAVKKTSPSGGGLHPIEVYPIIRSVESIPPGAYHYCGETHSLNLVKDCSADVGELYNEFTAGQSYPRNAHAIFVLTARFHRNFWKYRDHLKAYNVLFMDASHISQSFYLLSTKLGLGPFVTAAINNRNIEEYLRIDPYLEGSIAILGCGIPAKDHLGLNAEFDAFHPANSFSSNSKS